MKAKKSKKLNNTDNSKEESRYFGALLENMDSKIDVILEGHQVLDKKIDDLSNNVDKRFDEVDYKFETVFDELHLIRNDLKEKVGRDEFLVLEKRVAMLEKSKLR